MSEFFEWDSTKFGLGIPPIDAEHRQIVDAMNDLHRLTETRQPAARIGEALRKLQEVTKVHFEDEEVYMEQIGYPDLRKHRQVHKHLLERLDSFTVEFRRSGALSEEFFQFLKMWLKSHICGIDSQYARHVNAA